MGRLGAALLRRRMNVLTHCNTGALATGGHGTALGVIRTAHALGRIRMVYVDETRPYLQGARLTAWELKRDRIPFVLITDSMAAHFMARGGIGAVLVGADRITRAGDVANKIGTYGLAVLARAHGIPFYVVAPTSTLDLSLRRGRDIVIEERSADEVLRIAGTRIAPPGIRAAHPAFDVTPGTLVTAIVTEAGVAWPPYTRSLPRLTLPGGR
jgi:methylthioribose-1-phosphate isomerase